MNKLLFTGMLLATLAAGAVAAEDDREMGVFDIEVLRDGERVAEPMVAVHLEGPDDDEAGEASLVLGVDDEYFLSVVLDIISVDEPGAEVMVKFGYGQNTADEFSLKEQLTFPWREQVRLDYQRDSQSPYFEFIVSLDRTTREAMSERIRQYQRKHARSSD